MKAIRLQGNRVTDKGALCFSQLLNSKPKSKNQSISPTKQGSVNTSSSVDNFDNSFRLSSISYNNHFHSNNNDKINFRINLRELNLNDNLIGHVGVTALLGNAEDGILSPLKTLSLARCIGHEGHVDDVLGVLRIFSTLAANLRNSSQSALTKLVLDLSEEASANLLDSYMQLSAHRPIEPSIGAVFQSVSDALLNITHQNTINLSKVRLGAFHRVLFRYCQDARKALAGESVRKQCD